MSTKHRSGLHKNISSIFDGVPLPKNDDTKKPVDDVTAMDKTAGHLPPMPSASVEPPQTWSKEPPKAAPKPAQTSPIINKTAVTGKFQKIIGELLQELKAKVLTPPEGVSQSKHMATLILIPVLILVVVFVFGRTLLQSVVKGNKSNDGSAIAAYGVARTEIEWERPSPYPANLRDPMKKFSSSGALATVAGDIVVRGIVWSEDSPAAVIGTQIIYQGQTVQGTKILQITEDSVEFEKDGKKWVQKVAN